MSEPDPNDVVSDAMDSLFDPDSSPGQRDDALGDIKDVADQAHQEPGDDR